RGRALFEFLDADHDQRLGLRELTTAWTRLAAWDRDGDGCITRGEVPRQYHLVLTQGKPRGFLEDTDRLAYGPALRLPQADRGPLWFRKMDTNRDGDVSRREFLGSTEDFRRLDSDGDGLISVEEAEHFDAALRQQQSRP